MPNLLRPYFTPCSLHEEFVEVSAVGIDENVIRQFGIGFYLAYLVFEKAIVTIKHNDDEGYIWKSQDWKDH